MPHFPFARRTLAALSATVLLAGTVLAGTATSASAEPASWAVGECYHLTAAQIDLDDAPDVQPVPCTSAHTAEVFTTGTLPAGASETAKQKAVWSRCDIHAKYAALGLPYTTKLGNGGGILPAPGAVFFYTNADHTAYMCAVTIPETGKRGRVTYTAVDAPMADLVKQSDPRVTDCMMPGSDFPATAYHISCAGPYPGGRQLPLALWRIVDAGAHFTGGYPGYEPLLKYARASCRDKDADWALGVRVFPSAKQWKSGWRTIECLQLIA